MRAAACRAQKSDWSLCPGGMRMCSLLMTCRCCFTDWCDYHNWQRWDDRNLPCGMKPGALSLAVSSRRHQRVAVMCAAACTARRAM
jgi:hypothetical protein